EKRDWRIYADFAQVLINIARDLYVDEEFGVELVSRFINSVQYSGKLIFTLADTFMPPLPEVLCC
ncbi:MAG: hypothetical protein KKE00_11415, partial [Proteobacteria bacterium]|nr:hypothetical protein [Pseudomonadota bacterium]